MNDPVPRKGSWRGLDWWFCPVCPVDSDDEAAVARHIAVAHPPNEPSELQRMTAAARAAEEATADGPGHGDGAEPRDQANDNPDRPHLHRKRRN